MWYFIILGAGYSLTGGLDWLVDSYNNIIIDFNNSSIVTNIIEENINNNFVTNLNIIFDSVESNPYMVENKFYNINTGSTMIEKISLDNKMNAYMNDYDSLDGDDLSDLVGNEN